MASLIKPEMQPMPLSSPKPIFGPQLFHLSQILENSQLPIVMLVVDLIINYFTLSISPLIKNNRY